MMAEYIEREAAKDAIKKQLRTGDFFESRFNVRIDAIPAADVVEVVRCKDCVNGTRCINRQGEEYVDCVLDDYSVRKPNDFCNYGERWEEDAVD